MFVLFYIIRIIIERYILSLETGDDMAKTYFEKYQSKQIRTLRLKAKIKDVSGKQVELYSRIPRIRPQHKRPHKP